MTIYILQAGNNLWITKNPDFQAVSTTHSEPAVVVYSPIGELFSFRVWDGAGGSYSKKDAVCNPQLDGLPGF